MSLVFSGSTGNYAEISNAYNDLIRNRSASTISWWMKPSAMDFGVVMASKGLVAGGFFVELNNANGAAYFGLNNYSLVTAADIVAGSWVHCVQQASSLGWMNLTSFQIRRMVATSATYSNTAGTSLWLGRFDSGTFPYNGKLFDIRIWNRGLTLPEMHEVYCGHDVTSGLLERWKLDETTGSTFAGSVGGYTGSITGTPVWDSDFPTYGTYPGGSGGTSRLINGGLVRGQVL